MSCQRCHLRFSYYLSLADKLGVVELVVWDKDMLSKEYLGEVALPLGDWFVDKQTGEQTFFGFGNKVSLFLDLSDRSTYFFVLQSITLSLDYVDLNVQFTVDVFKMADILRMLSAFLKPKL